MYAIVKTGGKQYRVEKGQTLLVERLPDSEGATVALEPVLFRSDETVFEPAALARVSVQAKVLAHERGPKLRVFKFKPKRGYRRRTGHRQELTRLEVTAIKLGAGKAAAKPKGAAAKPKGAAAKPKGAAAKPKGAAAKPKGAAAKPKGAAAKPKGQTAKPKTSKEDDDGA
jgi:large subunit ribosomal protein L21